MITIETLNEVFNQHFVPPFLNEGDVNVSLSKDNTLYINIGRRDVEIDENGDVVGCGTMMEPIEKIHDVVEISELPTSDYNDKLKETVDKFKQSFDVNVFNDTPYTIYKLTNEDHIATLECVSHDYTLIDEEHLCEDNKDKIIKTISNVIRNMAGECTDNYFQVDKDLYFLSYTQTTVMFDRYVDNAYISDGNKCAVIPEYMIDYVIEQLTHIKNGEFDKLDIQLEE